MAARVAVISISAKRFPGQEREEREKGMYAPLGGVKRGEQWFVFILVVLGSDALDISGEGEGFGSVETREASHLPGTKSSRS